MNKNIENIKCKFHNVLDLLTKDKPKIRDDSYLEKILSYLSKGKSKVGVYFLTTN